MAQPNSPAGNEIAPLDCEPSDIRDRGQDIFDLGEDMIESAAVLKSVSDSQYGQYGKAIDKLRNLTDDTYVMLEKAGLMYKPTGTHLKNYAQQITTPHWGLGFYSGRCEELWREFELLPGDKDAPTQATGEDASDDAALAADAQNRAKEDKYEEWVTSAEAYDGYYDTWETAFDTAVTKIGSVLDDGLEDGFWDRVDAWIEVIQTALTIVAIVLAIAGMLIGGPIIAALAAVVAVVTLGLTIYQAIRGDKGWLDVALAVVGVIPFGKLGMVWNKAGIKEFGSSAAKNFNPKTYGKGWTATKDLWKAGSGNRWATLMQQGDGILTVPKGQRGLEVLTQLAFGKSSEGTTNMFTKHFTNMRGTGFAARVFTAPLSFAGASFEFMHTMVGQGFKIGGWTSSVGGLFGLDIPNLKTAGKVTTPIGELPVLDIPW